MSQNLERRSARLNNLGSLKKLCCFDFLLHSLLVFLDAADSCSRQCLIVVFPPPHRGANRTGAPLARIANVRQVAD